ncbi:hypothetical protein [Adlercreutzia muris]|uniref:hypothetical protein n=1 Tax=Adlercreutzia muris TaxID=1796610 RepID=UPI001F5616BC|nr:hypothetical protein [Adlercreutzia muris]
MKIEYASQKIADQCTGLKAAKKLFGGDELMARKLLARVQALESALVLKDIIVQRQFRFHSLHGDREGYFAIDVKSRRDAWRIILQPLDESGEPFDPCHIDEIAGMVRIVEVAEVSKHYE